MTRFELSATVTWLDLEARHRGNGRITAIASRRRDGDDDEAVGQCVMWC